MCAVVRDLDRQRVRGRNAQEEWHHVHDQPVVRRYGRVERRTFAMRGEHIIARIQVGVVHGHALPDRPVAEVPGEGVQGKVAADLVGGACGERKRYAGSDGTVRTDVERKGRRWCRRESYFLLFACGRAGVRTTAALRGAGAGVAGRAQLRFHIGGIVGGRIRTARRRLGRHPRAGTTRAL